ncbi:MAG: glycosyltransferase family 8 protein [Bacteroidales bacterium]|nr:glycosyltransferase family 8 protein [Bacteroidales bacterium]
MDIVFCPDNNYFPHCAVCITSICENNRGEDLHFFVLFHQPGELVRSTFSQLARTYNVPIDIVPIEPSLCATFPTLANGTATYHRLYIPEVIDADKALYLDSDTIVLGNLRELYDTPLDADTPCAMVVDQNADWPFLKNIIHTHGTYFNAGMMLMNLVYWRQHQVSQRIFEYISSRGQDQIMHDQGGINHVLENRIKEVSYKYNYQANWFTNSTYWMLDRSRFEEIYACGNNPVVVHFCGDPSYAIGRPWLQGCQHPLRHEYVHYAGLHDFVSQVAPIHRYTLSYKILKRLSITINKMSAKAQRYK